MRRRRFDALSAGAVVLALVLVGASPPRSRPTWTVALKPVALLVAGPIPAGTTAPPEPTALPPAHCPARTGGHTRPAGPEGDRRRRAQHGADISFTLLDRATGKVVSEGDPAAFPSPRWPSFSSPTTLLESSRKRATAELPEDRRGLELMLRSSDDFPADEFWIRDGRNEIITRVAERYKLTKTTPPYNGDWGTP